MKTIKLTKKQYELLRAAFMLGASSHLEVLNDETWDVDENLICKKALKNFNAYMRVIKKLEQKLNCIVP
jgi:outer membrane protein TolC